MDSEFVEVRGFPDYLINRSGIVKSKASGKPLKRRKLVKTGRVVVAPFLPGEPRVSREISVFALLARTFLDPEKVYERNVLPVPKDWDPSNTILDNVRLMKVSEFHRENEERKRREGLKKFKWDGSEKLTESPKPGFYWIPFVKFPVAISRDGEIYDFLKDRFVTKHLNKRGYVRVDLWNEETAKYTSWLVHRLLVRTFIEVPECYRHLPLSEVHVNHKDGIKTNNTVDNLEWCLNRENIEHACNTGLFNVIPVLARNIDTGEIHRFATISACERFLGISEGSSRPHLKCSNSVGRVVVNGHVIKLDDDSEWPDLLMHYRGIKKNAWMCNVVVTNDKTGDRYLFSNYTDACTVLNINKIHLRDNYTDGVPFEGYLFQTLT